MLDARLKAGYDATQRGASLLTRAWRGKTHSSLSGQKAYLNFELKDAHRFRLLPGSAFMMSKSDRSDFDGAPPPAVEDP
jgi:hypothetical protein